MKNTLLLSIISFGFVIHLAAQCPQHEVLLTSQAQVDNFRVLYPGCDTVTASIIIEGSDIVSLQELSGIASVNLLSILRTPNLHSLAGLDSLTYALALTIELTGLTNLEGLGGLDSVDWFLRISNNLYLQDLTGLSRLRAPFHLSVYNNAALTSLQGLVAMTTVGTLGVDYNPQLQDLTGMPLLETIGTLYVGYNDGLQSLSGLEQVTQIENDLLLLSNPVLTSIDALQQVTALEDIEILGNTALGTLSGLQSLTSVTGDVLVSGNHSLVNLDGMNALAEIEGNLEIAENDNLQSLSGLEALVKIGDRLTIRNNDALNNVEGIANLNALGSLEITFNDQLSLCSVESVCEHLTTGGDAVIGGNFDGCASPAQVVAGCVVATDESIGNNISIYPNPTSGIFIIEGFENEVLLLELFNTKQRMYVRETEHKEVDISTLPGGIYYLRIQSGNEVHTKKVVKQ